MLRHIKQKDQIFADAQGHVIESYFFREFKRKGAEGAMLSEAQFEGFFGEPEHTNGDAFTHFIDGLPVVVNKKLPKDQVEFYVGDKLLGRITNLYVPSEPNDKNSSDKP